MGREDRVHMSRVGLAVMRREVRVVMWRGAGRDEARGPMTSLSCLALVSVSESPESPVGPAASGEG